MRQLLEWDNVNNTTTATATAATTVVLMLVLANIANTYTHKLVRLRFAIQHSNIQQAHVYYRIMNETFGMENI